jgi:hypothetical protein
MSSYEKHEKEEKGRDESIEEKWARDPLGTAMGAVVLIWLGVLLMAANVGFAADWIGWDNWWAWFGLGVGVIFIVEALIRLVVPGFRRRVVGRFIIGLVLIFVGAGGTFLDIAFERWWPIIPIGVGLAILLGGLFRRRGP